MAASAVEVESLQLTNDQTLHWYHPADDPNVSYGFCSNCGSSLFWRESDQSTNWSICAGTLDQPTGLRTTQILYASEAADYHSLDPSVEQLATE